MEQRVGPLPRVRVRVAVVVHERGHPDCLAGSVEGLLQQQVGDLGLGGLGGLAFLCLGLDLGRLGGGGGSGGGRGDGLLLGGGGGLLGRGLFLAFLWRRRLLLGFLFLLLVAPLAAFLAAGLGARGRRSARALLRILPFLLLVDLVPAVAVNLVRQQTRQEGTAHLQLELLQTTHTNKGSTR